MNSSLLRLTILLLLATAPLFARSAETSYHVVYTGGTLSTLPLGTGVKLYIDSTLLRLVDDHLDALAIPVTTITGFTTTPDITASRVSFNHPHRSTIAITWVDGVQRGGVALRCHASECQGILAALQGVSPTNPNHLH